MERSRTDRTAAERPALEQWLDFHRATLLGKCAGLTGAELVARPVPPANLSLLGLVRHMTDVERGWFRRGVGREEVGPLYSTDDDSEADFERLDPGRAEEELARYRAEIALARQAAAGHSLDEPISEREGAPNVRWVFLHMVEEYARHNGHADLIRQAIDGSVGL